MAVWAARQGVPRGSLYGEKWHAEPASARRSRTTRFFMDFQGISVEDGYEPLTSFVVDLLVRGINNRSCAQYVHHLVYKCCEVAADSVIRTSYPSGTPR
jgi:hypothetical protein